MFFVMHVDGSEQPEPFRLGSVRSDGDDTRRARLAWRQPDSLIGAIMRTPVELPIRPWLRRSRSTCAVVAVLSVLAIAPAAAEVGSGTSRAEVRCEEGVARALSTQAARHASCVRSCVLRTDGEQPKRCLPPDYDEPTLRCILAGEAASRASMVRACPEDGGPRDGSCPEAFEQRWGSCADMAEARVATDHAQFGAFTNLVLCEIANRQTDPLASAKRQCQTALSRALVGYFDAVNDVYARCNVARVARLAPEGACSPGSTLHPRFSPGNVLPGIAERTVSAIDRACFAPPAVAPACYGAASGSPGSGAAWVSLVNVIAEGAADTNTFLPETSSDE